MHMRKFSQANVHSTLVYCYDWVRDFWRCLLNKSTGSYLSRSKKRFTLSWDNSKISAKRVHPAYLDSANKKKVYLSKSHWAVDGLVIVLIVGSCLIGLKKFYYTAAL